MLMLEENLQDVATEEAQTLNQHNICECVWCKPYFSSSINELTETINLKISDLDILKEAVKKKSLVPHPGETIETTSLEVNLSRSVVDSTMAHFLLAASEGNIHERTAVFIERQDDCGDI